jgi:acyl carrier protein
MNKVNEIITKTFKISAEDAAKDLGMKEVSRWDSLTHMDLITSIEDELKIQLTGDEIAEMITFDAVRNIVGNHISK